MDLNELPNGLAKPTAEAEGNEEGEGRDASKYQVQQYAEARYWIAVDQELPSAVQYQGRR